MRILDLLWHAGLAALALFLAVECPAQITLDGSVGPARTLTGPNFTIDSDAGQIRGTNLFHSFGRFNLQTGESATFTNTSSGPITNILSRVTAGERSFIDGTVRSAITGANLYLLNPSGVVFGPHAVLDLSGSFHVSTADYLRLGEGGVFHARLAAESVLTVSKPVAFGFLGFAPAAIAFDRSILNVPQGKTLSVIAGDATLTGAELRAASGRLDLASVASAGEVLPSASAAPPDLDVSSFTRMGRIDLSAVANLTVSGAAGAGTAIIRGGRLLIDSAASINANTSGPGNGAALGLDVRMTDEISLAHGAQIVAFSFGGSGRAGDARIAAGRLQIDSSSFLSVGTASAADGGNLAIEVGSLQMAEGGGIFVQSLGSGNGGNLTIDADRISLNGSSAPGLFTGVFVSSSGAGASGTLTIRSKSLDMSANSSISNGSGGSGPAGTLTIDVAGDITITGSKTPGVFTGLFANAFGTGRGGTLEIISKNLRLADHATIQAATFASGDAGSATVRTGRLEIGGGSSIFANALSGSGRAGNLAVTADDVVIRGDKDSLDPFGIADFTGLSTAAGPAAKKGGDIDVKAGSISVTDKGGIFSLSLGAGDAGNIRVVADDLRVTERSQLASSAGGTGRGGDIEIRAGTVTVSGAGLPAGPTDPLVSTIAAQALGSSGAAGSITITAGTLQVLDGAKVTTQTFGPGNGGNIAIQAQNVVVSGINASLDAFQKSSPSTAGDSGRSAIAASSERALLGDSASGNAGNVRIDAEDVQIVAGGALSSRTNTPGRGGNIDVIANRVTLASGALVSADSSTSAQAGRAGAITLSARDSVQIAASSVTTAADRAEGGAVAIEGNRIALLDGAVVSARSSGSGNAGDIRIAARDTVLGSNSSVSTEATLADGGNVTLIAPVMVHLSGSEVSTSVGTGQGKGGNIVIDPQFVVLDGSQIRADAFGGPGGSIAISADVFLTQNSVLSASSTLSTPGTIDIQARVTDVSGAVVRLPESAPIDASIIRAACAARLTEGSISSLALTGRDGLPPEPGAMLPSPLLSRGTAALADVADGWLDPIAAPYRFSLQAADRVCFGFNPR